jgi:hypothetical protein
MPGNMLRRPGFALRRRSLLRNVEGHAGMASLPLIERRLSTRPREGIRALLSGSSRDVKRQQDIDRCPVPEPKDEARSRIRTSLARRLASRRLACRLDRLSLRQR